jgi:trimeric autotransporter adhesin
VYALAVEPRGTLVAGGYFMTAGGVTVENVARWSGGVWSGLTSASGCCGTGVNHNVFALGIQPGAQSGPLGYFLLVGGSFWDLQRFARWDGNDWVYTPWTNDAVMAIEPHPDGGLVVGGYFVGTGNGGMNRIGRYTLEGWTAMGSGANNIVQAIAVMPNGDVIAGGDFTAAGDVPAAHIARWNGTSWLPLGAGVNGPVYELEVMPNGELIVGGSFTMAGNASANNIARWSDGSWSALGSGVDSYVHAFAVLPNGDVAVGGNFTAAGGNYSPYFAVWHPVCTPLCDADFNNDGDFGTDQDIEAFFACLAGFCCPTCGTSDFNGDGDFGTDQDIEAFFRVLAGGTC